jgi:hypothetical protein
MTPGGDVAGPEPDEHVEVTKGTPVAGRRALVQGLGVASRRLIQGPLSGEGLARQTRIRGSRFTYDGNARSFLLGVEGQRDAVDRKVFRQVLPARSP